MIDIGKIVLILYAVGMAIGGILGKVRGNSNISLIAGFACAGLISVCYMKAGNKPKSAFGFGAVIALAMTLQMFMRYQKTQHFMPAGLISIMSLVAFIALGAVWAKVDKSA